MQNLEGLRNWRCQVLDTMKGSAGRDEIEGLIQEVAPSWPHNTRGHEQVYNRKEAFSWNKLTDHV